jgi:two-component system chemotaxis response regulator CheB
MPIKTLVVDDTAIYRTILARVAASFEDVEVVGAMCNGALAIKWLEQTEADLVLLDIHMPEMDGIETLRHIRGQHPAAIVVMVSGVSSRSAATTIEALQLGAIDFVRKPDGDDFDANVHRLLDEFAPIMQMVRTRMYTRRFANPPAAESPAKSVAEPKTKTGSIPSDIALVAIGVSTGGPEALAKLIPALPANIPVPVVVVQHMPPPFTKSLAESLNHKSALRVVEAQEGEAIVTGSVYLAPGGRHLLLRQHEGSITAGLNGEPPVNSCRPSVDVLFRSIGPCCGTRGVVAVVLTGMGRDGLDGVRALKRRSCYCITQSADSCVVYGMPRSVEEAGLSDISLPIEAIAQEIRRVLRF